MALLHIGVQDLFWEQILNLGNIGWKLLSVFAFTSMVHYTTYLHYGKYETAMVKKKMH